MHTVLVVFNAFGSVQYRCSQQESGKLRADVSQGRDSTLEKLQSYSQAEVNLHAYDLDLFSVARFSLYTCIGK